MRKTDITVFKIDSRAFLKIDEVSAEIKDYKISSHMQGRTELEVVFEFESSTIEFSSAASSTEHLLRECGLTLEKGRIGKNVRVKDPELERRKSKYVGGAPGLVTGYLKDLERRREKLKKLGVIPI